MWLLFLTVEDELSLCSYDQLIGTYTNKETSLQAQNNFLSEQRVIGNDIDLRDLNIYEVIINRSAKFEFYTD